MIWLKENSNFLGYVPFLKKEYDEESIWEMSKHSCYDGWSRLSELVMKIQGIAFKFYGDFSNHYEVETQSLAEICFNFDFECFLIPSDSRIETYRKQIFEVFQNLTLYKVENFSEEDLEKKVAQAKQSLNQLVSTRTLRTIDYDISNFIRCAETSFANLSKLQKMFANRGYPLTHDLFADIEPNLHKKIFDKRETKITLKMG